MNEYKKINEYTDLLDSDLIDELCRIDELAEKFIYTTEFWNTFIVNFFGNFLDTINNSELKVNYE